MWVGARVMLPVLYFMLFTIYTCGNFTDLHCNIAEGIVIFFHIFFSCNVHPCGQFSAMFEQEHIFLPSRSYSLFLKPLAHNILQSVMVCIMMSTWTLSFNRPNRCNVRTVQVRVATALSDHTS